MKKFLNNPQINPAPAPQANPENDYNSAAEIWWTKASSEIDDLINEARYFLKQRKVKMSTLKNKFTNLFAGVQSLSNCWLFTSQNIANYFLDLHNKQPIRKFGGFKLNGPKDEIEKEFLKRQPGKADLLNNSHGADEMSDYLRTYGIEIGYVEVSHDFINGEKREERKEIAKKIAYFALLQHFSTKDTPVAINVGKHWITVAGIDENENALVLDSCHSAPEEKSLDSVVKGASETTMDYDFGHIAYQLEILFPYENANHEDALSMEQIGWDGFKDKMLSIVRK